MASGIRGVRLLTLLVVFDLVATACSSGSSSTRPARTTVSGSQVSTSTVRPIPTTTVPIKLATPREIEVSLLYSQGVAWVPTGWVFSGTFTIARVDEKLRIQRIVNGPIPKEWAAKGYNHVGDIDVVGDVIYAPFEQPNYALGHQATARFDLATLAFIDAVTMPQHENSFVTVDPVTMMLYSMDRFDGNALLRYEMTSDHKWRPLTPLRMNQTVKRVQGGDIAMGAIWLSTDDNRKGIYRVDITTGATTFVGSMHHLGAKNEGEGIDATQLPSGLLHTIMIAGTFAPVLLQHFQTR